jgi:hypothetical protein
MNADPGYPDPGYRYPRLTGPGAASYAPPEPESN